MLQSISLIGVALVVFSTVEAWFAFKLPFYHHKQASTDETQAAQNYEKFTMHGYLILSYLRRHLCEIRQDKNIWLSIIGLSLFLGVSQLIVAAFPANYKMLFNQDNALIIQAILAVSGLGLILGSYISR